MPARDDADMRRSTLGLRFGSERGSDDVDRVQQHVGLPSVVRHPRRGEAYSYQSRNRGS